MPVVELSLKVLLLIPSVPRLEIAPPALMLELSLIVLLRMVSVPRLWIAPPVWLLSNPFPSVKFLTVRLPFSAT